MPPAFNLSQDQTLQFNPSRANPLRNRHTHSKQSPKKLLTREHFITLKASSQDRRLLHPSKGQIQPGDNPLPNPAPAPQKTQSTHTHRLFILLKSDAVFAAAVSGEGRIIRIETRGSTLFGVFHSQNSPFLHAAPE
jgi:hypothetical protein